MCDGEKDGVVAGNYYLTSDTDTEKITALGFFCGISGVCPRHLNALELVLELGVWNKKFPNFILRVGEKVFLLVSGDHTEDPIYGTARPLCLEIYSPPLPIFVCVLLPPVSSPIPSRR